VIALVMEAVHTPETFVYSNENTEFYPRWMNIFIFAALIT
jgi:hypothetical protein